MRTIDGGMQSLLSARLHRLATCWKITRTDAVILRFTDHDVDLTFEGEVYSPVGGFTTSARQKKSGLRASNLEVNGILNSTEIKYDDLRAERYRDAEVLEYLIDWQYPWVGYFLKNRYWIAETEYNNESWSATFSGMTRWLQSAVGKVYDRLCPYELGNAKCGVTLATYTQTAVPVTAVISRKAFTASSLSEVTGDFDAGSLIFTSGSNTGLVREIKTYLTGGIFEMQLDFPFDIAVSDEFTVSQGCKKRSIEDCKDKFNNIVNFGGYPFIPGTDAIMKTPDGK